MTLVLLGIVFDEKKNTVHCFLVDETVVNVEYILPDTISWISCTPDSILSHAVTSSEEPKLLMATGVSCVL